MNEILREAANALDDLSRKQGAPAQIAEELRSLNVALEQQQWIKAEKAKAAAYDDAAALVEKMAHDYMHEHGSYDPSTNSWEIPKHADRIEALEDAVEAIRKRKAEKCHVTQAALVCGCRESYPQLVPGELSHGTGCPLSSSSAIQSPTDPRVKEAADKLAIALKTGYFGDTNSAYNLANQALTLLRIVTASTDSEGGHR